MQQPLVSLEEAVALARATHDGTVILTDAADATSSGASGDSNAILRALADGGYGGTVLAPIVDPDAVAASVAAGLGGTAPDDHRRPARSGAVRADAVRGRRGQAERRPVHERGRRPRVVVGRDCRPEERDDDDRRHQPAGHALRPLAVPRPRPGPARLRCRRRQVAALRAALLPRLGGPDDRRRCARVDQREPAQPGSRALSATDLPARRRRPVHAAGRAVLAAEVRRPAGAASARPVEAHR